jgi:hypothetical protein
MLCLSWPRRLLKSVNDEKLNAQEEFKVFSVSVSLRMYLFCLVNQKGIYIR